MACRKLSEIAETIRLKKRSIDKITFDVIFLFRRQV
jgi:hypothetical protein